MGHQVYFHATPPDLADLQARIARLHPMLILHDRSPVAKPRVLPSLLFEENGHPHLFYRLVREEDIENVVMEYVPEQEHWSVEDRPSPVIKLTSCYFDGRILRRGRLYYVDGFYGPDDLWVEKPEPFRIWASRVLRQTKKVLKKCGRDYIGTDAQGWVEKQNGRLVTD